MKRVAVLAFLLLLVGGIAATAQSQSSKKPPTSPTDDNPDDILNSPMTPPRSDRPTPNSPESEDPHSYSSSKDSSGDITPPPDDATHPGSEDVPVIPSEGVTEMKPWDPHAADKDVEVGLFYFKRSNYRAAEARFRDALYWQDNHAEATYRLAAVLEKERKNAEAQQYYRSYLKILPDGEFAADSKRALERLGTASEGQKKTQSKKAAISPPS
jgi:tetratricopeptide (TPR) repeat protein